jgi:hypothetical protein
MNSKSEELNAAKARMREALLTLFSFDYGVTGADLYGQVAWILDEVIQPEFERLLPDQPNAKTWSIMQMGETVPKTLRSGLSKEKALSACKAFPWTGPASKVWVEKEWP